MRYDFVGHLCGPGWWGNPWPATIPGHAAQRHPGSGARHLCPRRWCERCGERLHEISDREPVVSPMAQASRLTRRSRTTSQGDLEGIEPWPTPTNPHGRQVINWRIKQDATGARTPPTGAVQVAERRGACPPRRIGSDVISGSTSPTTSILQHHQGRALMFGCGLVLLAGDSPVFVFNFARSVLTDEPQHPQCG